jgi:hypothetical protein
VITQQAQHHHTQPKKKKEKLKPEKGGVELFNFKNAFLHKVQEEVLNSNI